MREKERQLEDWEGSLDDWEKSLDCEVRSLVDGDGCLEGTVGWFEDGEGVRDWRRVER